MAFIKNKLDDGNLEGLVIFSGTVFILPQKINFGDYFGVELSNPREKLNRLTNGHVSKHRQDI